MGVEIERKFLVKRERLPELTGGTPVKQGYLPTDGLVSVRPRVKGGAGFLTVKGPSTEDGLSRAEFEYPIPLEDAEAMLDGLCADRTVMKTRYEIVVGGRLWEIDVFGGANEGLIIAEVELDRADEDIDLPEWAGTEVTGDVRFFNQRLADRPWPEWGGDG